MAEHVLRGCQPRQAWALLTKAEGVGIWWGQVNEDFAGLAQGVTVTTRDDWTATWVEDIIPEQRLHLTIAYLGVEPIYSVLFTLAPHSEGCVVRVNVDDLEGWSDFVPHNDMWNLRLRHLAQCVTQHDRLLWDYPIEEKVDLASTTWLALHPKNLTEWLPTSATVDGVRSFYVVDSQGPRRLDITSWFAHYDEYLRLRFDAPPTEATVSVEATGTRTQLSVKHTGWFEEPGEPPSDAAMLLRERFRAAWVAAIRSAREMSAGSDCRRGGGDDNT